MAIDPVFSSPSAAEPSAPRSRGSDAPRDGQEFTLPDAKDDKRPAPQDKGAAARDSVAPAESKTPEAGPGEAAAAGEAKPQGAAVAKPAHPAATLPSVSPTVVPTAPAAGQKPPAAATDIGALASILAAADEATAKGAADPAAPVAEAVQDGVVPAVVKPGKKKAGEEAEAASPAPEPASAPAQPIPAVPAAPGLAVLLEAGATAAGAQNGSDTGAGTGEAAPAPVGAGGPGVPANTTVFQRIATAAPGLATAGEQPAADAGKVDLKAGALPAAQPAAKGHAASEPAAAAKTDPDPAPLAQQGAQPAQAEFKLPENLQQALSPIDLSAMVAQASAKPAAAHPQAAALPDPAAAQGQPAPQAQANGLSMPTPLHVVPIEIGMRALAGAKSFDIRLDPAELGRVDVNLSISDKGEVSARLVVDRVETLHLLQRDARTLERAFEQAGLKPSDSGVDITLRDNSGQGFRQQRQQDEAPQRQRRGAQTDEIEAVGGVAAVATQPSRQIVRLGGVDLSI